MHFCTLILIEHSDFRDRGGFGRIWNSIPVPGDADVF